MSSPGPGLAAPRVHARRFPQPFQICPAPSVLGVVKTLAEDGQFSGARVLPFEANQPPVILGPAILVLGPRDLRGPHRESLLELAEAGRPGRPLLYGSNYDRDTLLEAINSFRVLQIIPEAPDHLLLVEGIHKAQETLELECGLEQAAFELGSDTERLQEALGSLRETEARTRQAERLATLGRITTSLIPVIGAHLDALEDFNHRLSDGPASRDPRLDELLRFAFAGIRSLHAMLDEIRGYADSGPGAERLEIVDADEVARFVVAFCRFDPLSGGRRIRSELTSASQIRVDAFRLHQSLINLMRNAFQATPPGGEVVVRTAREGAHVIIDVENNGEPITPEVRRRLFEPFFSTKGEAGVGLGLSTCRSAIERLNGSISCSSEPGSTTRFRIQLPAV